MTHRRLLYLILALYTALGLLYLVATPPFEASDELSHYPMVNYLARSGLQLPPLDPAAPGAWRQEGAQPPLYYLLAAVLTSGIDTADMHAVRRLNPHADIGIASPDGNVNMIVQRPDALAFPWRGTVLAVYITRLFSLTLGAATVITTYAIARAVFPGKPLLAPAAAALNAFLPMFLFIAASVNNDNLSTLLGGLLTLLIVHLLKTSTLPRLRLYVVIGLAAGASLLAKLNLGFLIPFVALALLILSFRLKDWRPLVIGGGISGGLTILIAGWWYLRNMQLYRDPTALNIFLDLVGRRATPASLSQLWSERESFTRAYWGLFGGVNIPLPDALYTAFNLIGGLALLGVFACLAAAIYRWLSVGQREIGLPAAITLIWPLVTFLSFLRWTAETPASQGRLLFGALSCLSLWMAIGLTWWQPQRLRPYTLLVVCGFFFATALAAPLAVIQPAYALPPLNHPTDTPAITVFAEPNGGQIALIGSACPETVSASADFAQPGGRVWICPVWRIDAPLRQDYSLFIHLVTPDGVILAQRDIYPGGGKLATSDLSAGSAWINPVAITLPITAYAPMSLDIFAGWYHQPTGERLRSADDRDTTRIGSMDLQPRVSILDVPNPTSISFDNQIELIGYSLSDLSPAPGESLELVLYWRSLRLLDKDYKVFAQILDPATLTRYAASDAMPAAWTRPTTTWQPGEIITDTHLLTVAADTLPGIYVLQIGLYREAEDGSLPRLPVLTDAGAFANDTLSLTRVRILLTGETP